MVCSGSGSQELLSRSCEVVPTLLNAILPLPRAHADPIGASGLEVASPWIKEMFAHMNSDHSLSAEIDDGEHGRCFSSQRHRTFETWHPPSRTNVR